MWFGAVRRVARARGCRRLIIVPARWERHRFTGVTGGAIPARAHISRGVDNARVGGRASRHSPVDDHARRTARGAARIGYRPPIGPNHAGDLSEYRESADPLFPSTVFPPPRSAAGRRPVVGHSANAQAALHPSRPAPRHFEFPPRHHEVTTRSPVTHPTGRCVAQPRTGERAPRGTGELRVARSRGLGRPEQPGVARAADLVRVGRGRSTGVRQPCSRGGPREHLHGLGGSL